MFETFDVGITPAGDDALWLSAVSRLGAVHGVPRRLERMRIPDLLAQSRTFRRGILYGERQSKVMEEFAETMRSIVFGTDEVRALFEHTRGTAADRSAPLLVRVLAGTGALASLPWELLLDPNGGSHRHLTLSSDAHVVRLARKRTSPSRSTVVVPPLRVLLILSSPRSTAKHTSVDFDLYEEKSRLVQQFSSLIESGLLELDVEDRPTYDNLATRISRHRDGFHVVHYLGHARRTGLILEDRDGKATELPAQQLLQLLQGCPNLRLTVLSGCQTAEVPDAAAAEPQWRDALSLADRCLESACENVVGMQAVLPPHTEQRFSSTLYQALTSGRTVADAVTLARAALRTDGFGTVDWAIPSLFVAGTSLEPIIDRNAPAIPVVRAKCRLLAPFGRDTPDRDLFVAHDVLRDCVDFLSGRKSTRLLVLNASDQVLRTHLLARALDDSRDALEFQLYVCVPDLVSRCNGALDLYAEMSEWINELFRARRLEPVRRVKKWTSEEWWSRIAERLRDHRIAMVFDDVSAVPDQRDKFAQHIRKIVERDDRVRVIMVGDPGLATELSTGMSQLVTLTAPQWRDIFRWIRRNLRELEDFDEPRLQHYFGTFGAVTAEWRELARAFRVAQSAGSQPSLEELVASIVESRPRSAADVVPSVVAATAEQRSKSGGARFRVATARSFQGNDPSAFARAVTAFAVRHEVAGWVTAESENSPSSAIAELLPVTSPFTSRPAASVPDVIQWLQSALELQPHIVLLDFAVQRTGDVQERFEKMLTSANTRDCLLIAAAGSGRVPYLPAWSPSVVAVGGLSGGRIADYSYWEAVSAKPDLFAEGTLDGTSLADFATGKPSTSNAAVRCMLTALLVWATDPTLSAQQVRKLLVRTASPLTDNAAGPRALDIESALREVRTGLITRALDRGALELRELSVASGLPAHITDDLVEDMFARNLLHRVIVSERECYELRARGGGSVRA